MYVGVTNDLKRRVYEHRNKLVVGFTERYNINKLVYYEQTDDVITRTGSGERNQEMASREEEWFGRNHESGLEGLKPRFVMSYQGYRDFSLRSK
jgi:putative endonuclease